MRSDKFSEDRVWWVSQVMETSEAPEAALDMRVMRAGHDKIPLARIERRGSEAARSAQGAPEAEQTRGESIRDKSFVTNCEEEELWVSVIQHYQQTGLCWSWQLFIENLQAVSLILISWTVVKSENLMNKKPA